MLITKKTTLSSTELYQEAERRYDELYRMRAELEKTLVKYPEGSIHVIRNRGYVQYYLRKQSGQSCGEYLSKRQTDTIQIYLQKKYMQEVLRLLRSEMDSIEKFLRNCKPSQDKIRGLFSEQPEEIRKHLNPVDTSDADYIKAWSETAYDKKLISGTIPVFITNKGEPVRSKSELIIANRLYDLQIPYKYECPVWLSGEKKIYPDFTVLNIRKRREIYWEHRGMMDGQEYANHSVQRMREYQQAGIYLGEGLIITEETSSVPLDTGEIDRVIQHYILNTD